MTIRVYQEWKETRSVPMDARTSTFGRKPSVMTTFLKVYTFRKSCSLTPVTLTRQNSGRCSVPGGVHRERSRVGIVNLNQFYL